MVDLEIEKAIVLARANKEWQARRDAREKRLVASIRNSLDALAVELDSDDAIAKIHVIKAYLKVLMVVVGERPGKLARV